MTTIAYCNGIIAYDSRAMVGETIVWDDFEKCQERNGVKFVMCGSNTDMNALMDAYFGERLLEVRCSAMVVDRGRVFHVSHENEAGILKTLIPPHLTYAIGSGRDHALTAMDMGANAEKAIAMTMKRDPSTGGQIRLLDVRRQEGLNHD